MELAYTDHTTHQCHKGGKSDGKEQPGAPNEASSSRVWEGTRPGVLRGAALEHLHLVGMVRDEEGLAGCSPSLATWGVLSLAGEAVGLRGERSQSEKVCSQDAIHPSTLPTSCPLLTSARLTYSSWAVFRFSFFPPQAFRAEACRARP